ncbi:S1C family serine protease [Hyalangium versicolor]|uniref:S1C family serine protease n=1 Tax=Hyalangium versicolor TaxID=2861190 RepID=UPI001CD039C1|nr:S1C family serine protease [Hyalangium versicolor]
MADSFEARCLRCGAPDPGDKARCVCGASLLIDVSLKEPVADERRRFALARALALLGPPAPTFSQARISLGLPGERLVRGVSRAFAQKLVAVLSEHGVSAVLQPAEPLVAQPVAEAPRRSGWGVLVAVLLLVVVAGAAHRLWSSQSPETRKSVAFGLGAPSLASEETRRPVGLSTQEISQRSMPSTVSLRCENHMGSGFFVEEELALTNAHVACPVGKRMSVLLPDGRQLIGETLARDEVLDLATVRVVGAKAVPLKVGDVTRLQPGDPIVFIGSPKGLDFTVHEGKVGYVGRQDLGIGYVQVNATINPGNSGGPLLDGRGEVVGVVSMKIMDAEGLGLALPIAYASKLTSVPSSPEAAGRWEELLARVSRDEQREIENYKEDMAQPRLDSIAVVPNVGLVVMLIEHFDSPPSRKRHGLVLQAGSEPCSMPADFEFWFPILDAVKRVEDSRRMRWIVAHGLTEGVYVGAARLPVENCTLRGTGKAWLKVDGAGDGELDKYEVSLQSVAEARAIWERRQGAIKAWERDLWKMGVQGERTREEAEQWRNSFRRARERLSRAEESQRQLREDSAAGKNVRQQLADAEAETKLAKEQLGELERYASSKNIPPEWRQ